MPCSRQFPGQVGLPLRGLGARGRPAAPSTCGCPSALSTPHVPPARPPPAPSSLPPASVSGVVGPRAGWHCTLEACRGCCSTTQPHSRLHDPAVNSSPLPAHPAHLAAAPEGSCSTAWGCTGFPHGASQALGAQGRGPSGAGGGLGSVFSAAGGGSFLGLSGHPRWHLLLSCPLRPTPLLTQGP